MGCSICTQFGRTCWDCAKWNLKIWRSYGAWRLPILLYEYAFAFLNNREDYSNDN